MGQYCQEPAERLAAFTDDDDDGFQIQMGFRFYYCRTRSVAYRNYSEFLSRYRVEIDEEDRLFIREFERAWNRVW